MCGRRRDSVSVVDSRTHTHTHNCPQCHWHTMSRALLFTFWEARQRSRLCRKEVSKIPVHVAVLLHPPRECNHNCQCEVGREGVHNRGAAAGSHDSCSQCRV
jgi:hypothetical protein